MHPQDSQHPSKSPSKTNPINLRNQPRTPRIMNASNINKINPITSILIMFCFTY